ncbi:MAG TPA: hypothetical protein VD997_17700 [Phycisphaerales bacterium]|nr:hypothetical protein [Phycisphaerales bacterium]
MANPGNTPPTPGFGKGDHDDKRQAHEGRKAGIGSDQPAQNYEADENQTDAMARGTLHNQTPQQGGHGKAGAKGPGGKS